MKETDEFYALSIEDIQTVAEEVCDRKLTDSEIKKVIPRIDDYMPWFDVIELAIQEVVTP